MQIIILTGIAYADGTTGIAIYERDQLAYYEHRKPAKGCHGTGDVFASAFSGALLQGYDGYSSAKIAAEFTVKRIEETVGDAEHWYGVEFEKALPELIGMLGDHTA